MEPKIRVEVSGLTALDQMELEQQTEWTHATVQPDETEPGKLGQLPLVTMILETTKIVGPPAILALGAWLAKTRRKVKVKIERESAPDGWKKETIEIHAKSSQDIQSELIEAARHLTRD
jgi:hypothetical protein